jgi:hypothetical protein
LAGRLPDRLCATRPMSRTLTCSLQPVEAGYAGGGRLPFVGLSRTGIRTPAPGGRRPARPLEHRRGRIGYRRGGYSDARPLTVDLPPMGRAALAYAEAVCTDSVSAANYCLSLLQPKGFVGFARQAPRPDYAEGRPFGTTSASGQRYRMDLRLGSVPDKVGSSVRRCQTQLERLTGISRTPHYYDNIGYADLRFFLSAAPLWLNLSSLLPRSPFLRRKAGYALPPRQQRNPRHSFSMA